MSLRTRSTAPALPGARLNHVVAVGHAAAANANVSVGDVGLEQLLAGLDEVSGKRKQPSKADVERWRKQAAQLFKESAVNGQRTSKEQARELADFMLRKYNGAKNLEHWVHYRYDEMARIMTLRWRKALSPANWENIKKATDGDRTMALETGANLHALLAFDKRKGHLNAQGAHGEPVLQDTIQLTIAIVSHHPKLEYSHPAEVMGSELMWEQMGYSEMARKIDAYIYQSMSAFYAQNQKIVGAAKDSKVGRGSLK